jgi:segregation and condensation protein A
MRELNLDIAGEFLVMAATLAHLKSRMLLPRDEVASQLEPVDEALDPRADLVRRLLDYQRYKAAAEQLSRRRLLGRDVFVRRVDPNVPRAREVAYLEVSVYRLVEALDRVIQAAAPEVAHEVMRERISLTQAMVSIATRVRQGEVSFYQLFQGERSRGRIVVTFLALLEMCKRRWLRLSQTEDGREIRVAAQEDALTGLELPEVDEREYR